MFQMSAGEFSQIDFPSPTRNSVAEESKHSDQGESEDEIYQMYDEMCKLVSKEFQEDQKRRNKSPKEKRKGWN